MGGERDRQAEFMQAIGESFADCVCPPVPQGNMFVADCWDIVGKQIGDEVTPSRLAALTRTDLETLRKAFGTYFEYSPPTLAQVKAAIQVSLSRWPVGSLGEAVEQDAAPDRESKPTRGSRPPRRR